MIDEKKLIEELQKHLVKVVTQNSIGGIVTQTIKGCIGIIKEQPQADATDTNVGKWIPIEAELPKEHESIFAKFKGTDKWKGGMFEKSSDDVNVTIELEDGSRITRTTHTIDGEWGVEKFSCVKQKVVAWQPLPQPYKKEGVENE